MSESQLDDVLAVVGKLAGSEAHYFYAEQRGARYSLTTEMLLGVAAFLVGAFCDGFAGYIKGQMKTLGQDVARQLWERTRTLLHRNDLDRRKIVESSVSAARSSMNQAPMSRSFEAFKFAEELTVALLIEAHYPESRATTVAHQLTIILRSELLQSEGRDANPK